MHHSRALILKKEAWGEADWRVTALSADFGKIRLLAQGARKHGAKLQGHLEPGAISEISFVVGRNGYRLTTARLEVFPDKSRNFLEKLAALLALLETLDRNLLEERDQARELLATAEAALAILETARDSAAIRRGAVWFHARLLIFLGLFPSPLSPEAGTISALREFAVSPPSLLGAIETEPVMLERELAWLTRRLGSAFTPIQAQNRVY
ncbi:MAG: recombination protein O N-terminal domain-containing protein [Candidatus Sungbacteria bacterium]|uniref:Recombination protein O N-terminal domain-containing protein n=1 Tax=Candidatus Sungiibacteriota bacterium TaxID=2750080 RepID=A0A932YWA4_9BACT|nr:recombination protein O N-terminal domain-containing protein [Candidatus Sungbacteria bacterium]